MSADRTTEILNYLSAISREIGAFRTETNARFIAIDQRFAAIDQRFERLEADIREVRTEMRGLKERFDGRFDKLLKVFLDFRLRTTDLEQRVHALDGKHPDIDPY